MGSTEIRGKTTVPKGIAAWIGKSVILFAIVSFVYDLVHGHFDPLSLAFLIWMGGELSRDNSSAYKWGVFVFGITAIATLWHLGMLAFDIKPVELFDEVVQPGKRTLTLLWLGFWGVWRCINFAAIVIRSVKVARPFWTRRTVITVSCFFGIPLGVVTASYLSMPEWTRPEVVKKEHS